MIHNFNPWNVSEYSIVEKSQPKAKIIGKTISLITLCNLIMEIQRNHHSVVFLCWLNNKRILYEEKINKEKKEKKEKKKNLPYNNTAVSLCFNVERLSLVEIVECYCPLGLLANKISDDKARSEAIGNI